MKKMVILLFLVLVVSLVSASWFSDSWNKITGKAVAANCVDSDARPSNMSFMQWVKNVNAGRYDSFTTHEILDIYHKGTLTYNGRNYEDSCKEDVLKEYYCKNGKIKSISYPCFAGCNNGTCITPEYTCVDSDGGLNTNVAGQINHKNQLGAVFLSKGDLDGISKDECLYYSGLCGTFPGFRCKRYNDPRYVREAFCNTSLAGSLTLSLPKGSTFYSSKHTFSQPGITNAIANYSILKCPDGTYCSDGKCASDATATLCYYQDYDRGIIMKTKGVETRKNNYCLPNGKLRVYSCEYIDKSEYNDADCPSGFECKNDSCVPKLGVSQVKNCQDSDTGINLNEQGFTKGPQKLVVYEKSKPKVTEGSVMRREDFCMPRRQQTKDSVKEYYCDEAGFLTEKDFSCNYDEVCREGACQNLESLNQNCYDSDKGFNFNIKGNVSGEIAKKYYDSVKNPGLGYSVSIISPTQISFEGQIVDINQEFSPYSYAKAKVSNITFFSQDSKDNFVIITYTFLTDFCSGNYVAEQSCYARNVIGEAFYCPEGCNDGKCIGKLPEAPELIYQRDLTLS